jgi:hypothetical protein
MKQLEGLAKGRKSRKEMAILLGIVDKREQVPSHTPQQAEDDIPSSTIQKNCCSCFGEKANSSREGQVPLGRQTGAHVAHGMHKHKGTTVALRSASGHKVKGCALIPTPQTLNLIPLISPTPRHYCAHTAAQRLWY